jgi:hypothetical protein
MLSLLQLILWCLVETSCTVWTSACSYSKKHCPFIAVFCSPIKDCKHSYKFASIEWLILSVCSNFAWEILWTY